MNHEIKDIVIIGSGNVAHHLIKMFSDKGIRVLQILGRNETTANHLSKVFGIPYITNAIFLENNADLYILAVQDDCIVEAAEKLGLTDQLLVHTSGFSSIDKLKNASSRTGVIWPIQTFTAGMETTYENIPFLIEGSDPVVTGKLKQFAGLVSNKVLIANSTARQNAHLAAVISSNLSNRLYSLASVILDKQHLPFDLLGPLIRETARKAAEYHPLESQTGPAARHDHGVIGRHLEMLRDDPETAEIYRLISINIMKHYHGNSEKL